MRTVDIVVHAAALKQVPACEYNPIEAINTNINGARNIIDAAIDCGVEKVIEIDLNPEEKSLMDESVSHVKALVGTVRETFPDLA